MPEERKPKTRAPKENEFPMGQASSVPQKENKAPFGAQQGKYLYCVIKEKKPKKFNILGQSPLDSKHLTGQEGKEVYTINEGDLAICVSDTSKEEYSFIKEHLICHQKVIEEVMRKGYDVLPVRFGTVAPSTEYVKEKLLKAKAQELLETFKIIEGRVELGVRAFWKDMPGIFREIVAENKEIQVAKKEVEKNPNQFKIAKVGELVEKAFEKKREMVAFQILEPLKKLSVDFKERELLRQRDIMKNSMIVSSAFLVSKQNEKEFDRKIDELFKRFCEKVTFKYIGPIPPFNFVELRLKI